MITLDITGFGIEKPVDLLNESATLAMYHRQGYLKIKCDHAQMNAIRMVARDSDFGTNRPIVKVKLDPITVSGEYYGYGNQHVTTPIQFYSEWVNTDPRYVNRQLSFVSKIWSFDLSPYIHVLEDGTVIYDDPYYFYSGQDTIGFTLTADAVTSMHDLLRNVYPYEKQNVLEKDSYPFIAITTEN